MSGVSADRADIEGYRWTNLSNHPSCYNHPDIEKHIQTNLAIAGMSSTSVPAAEGSRTPKYTPPQSRKPLSLASVLTDKQTEVTSSLMSLEIEKGVGGEKESEVQGPFAIEVTMSWVCDLFN